MYKTELFDKLADIYKDYDVVMDVRYSHENDTDYEFKYIIIKNPQGENDIEIIYDGNGVSDGELILSFSYYHEHIYDYYITEGENHTDYFVTQLREIIDNFFLNGKMVAVGFWVDDMPILGSASELSNIEKLSAEEILETYKKFFPGKEYYEKVKGRECCCKIRGWDRTYSKDLNFIIT